MGLIQRSRTTNGSQSKISLNSIPSLVISFSSFRSKSLPGNPKPKTPPFPAKSPNTPPQNPNSKNQIHKFPPSQAKPNPFPKPPWKYGQWSSGRPTRPPPPAMAVAAAPSAPWCGTSKHITSSLPPLPILLSPSTTLFFRQALPGSSATTATVSPPSPLAPTPLA